MVTTPAFPEWDDFLVWCRDFGVSAEWPGAYEQYQLEKAQDILDLSNSEWLQP